MSSKKSQNGHDVKPPQFETVRADDFQTIYFNHAQGSISAFDLALTLSQASAGGDRVILEQKAKVIFSPLEAKVLQKILANLLLQYERQFGAVNVPDGVMPIDIV
jgi:hypothetical protein